MTVFGNGWGETVSGVQAAGTWCPDCELYITAEAFVEHREERHPPRALSLAVSGIRTATRFGTDPDEESD